MTQHTGSHQFRQELAVLWIEWSWNHKLTLVVVYIDSFNNCWTSASPLSLCNYSKFSSQIGKKRRIYNLQSAAVSDSGMQIPVSRASCFAVTEIGRCRKFVLINSEFAECRLACSDCGGSWWRIAADTQERDVIVVSVLCQRHMTTSH